MAMPLYLGRHRRQTRQEALALLRHAQALIADPEHLTRGQWARDRWSHPVLVTSERAARYCVGGALVRAHFDLHGNPGYLTAEEEVRPARLELAIELLGRNAGRLLGRRVGWVLVEWELLAQKGDWDGVAAQLKPKEQAPTVSWLGLVVSLGDDRRIKHAELLAAYAAAIRELEANLADGGRGGQR